MKKSLIALATLAAVSGAAMAQSSVALFGVLDTAVTRGSGSLTSLTSMTTSSFGSSQLGFRGSEDLGGGMGAHFWLEMGINNDSGAGSRTNTNNQASGSTPNGQGLAFNRRSTASLSGSFGEIRLGRDYTPQFANLTRFDPFNTNGVGTNQMLAGQLGILSLGNTSGPTIRASNSVAWLWNHGANASIFSGGNGFHAMVQYYMGENLSTVAAPVGKNDGNGYGIRVGYNDGPLAIALATGRTTYQASGNSTMTNLGASYNLGVATLGAQVSNDKLGTVSGRGYLLSAVVPVGSGQFKGTVSNSRNSTTTAAATKVALGYVHSLSKRTSLYATYARVSNKNGAAFALGGATTAANQASTGMDFGVRHDF